MIQNLNAQLGSGQRRSSPSPPGRFQAVLTRRKKKFHSQKKIIQASLSHSLSPDHCHVTKPTGGKRAQNKPARIRLSTELPLSAGLLVPADVGQHVKWVVCGGCAGCAGVQVCRCAGVQGCRGGWRCWHNATSGICSRRQQIRGPTVPIGQSMHTGRWQRTRMTSSWTRRVWFMTAPPEHLFHHQPIISSPVVSRLACPAFLVSLCLLVVSFLVLGARSVFLQI